MDRRRALLAAIVNDSKSERLIQLCDVAYWDGNAVKTCSYDNYTASLGIAIGVVVIPEGFAPDGKARIIGLKPMDASGNMTNSETTMYWASSKIDTGLTNYTMVPITDNTGNISSESNMNGYMPSDKFTSTQSYVDSGAKYCYDDYDRYIPSPYLGDIPNPDYYRTISGNNALSDFNGLTNTQKLVGLGTIYRAANACWNYKDGSGSNVQWYLPATGELGYLMTRFNAINSVIVSLGGIATNSSNIFWSSSEYDKNYAYYLNTRDGYIYAGRTKNTSSYVRPFAIIDNGDGSIK